MNDYDYDATLASDDILGLYMRASSEELPRSDIDIIQRRSHFTCTRAYLHGM